MHNTWINVLTWTNTQVVYFSPYLFFCKIGMSCMLCANYMRLLGRSDKQSQDCSKIKISMHAAPSSCSACTTHIFFSSPLASRPKKQFLVCCPLQAGLFYLPLLTLDPWWASPFQSQELTINRVGLFLIWFWISVFGYNQGDGAFQHTRACCLHFRMPIGRHQPLWFS